ncbi:MAG: hypothetical protein NW220_01760 [Leptolyngbyaceae cyanobacterium bins.349]|nr:hypothetical protein [Leptolyngbyaceae cyanobacterium bins.349]
MPLSQPYSPNWLVTIALLTTASATVATVAVVNPAGAIAQEQQPTALPTRLANEPTLRDRLLAEMKQTQNQPSRELRAALNRSLLLGAVTSNNPSSIQLSTPSLWWISDQLAALRQFGNKLIQQWVARPAQAGEPGQVDLLVNRQQWSLLDYFQRYEFVNKFSAIARSFGYNTRVYDNPDRIPVALYICDFSARDINLLRSPQGQLAPGSANTTVLPAAIANSLTCDLNLVGAATRPR